MKNLQRSLKDLGKDLQRSLKILTKIFKDPWRSCKDLQRSLKIFARSLKILEDLCKDFWGSWQEKLGSLTIFKDLCWGSLQRSSRRSLKILWSFSPGKLHVQAPGDYRKIPKITFLSLVPVSLNKLKGIFQNVSLNVAMAQTFLLGVRNWNTGVSRRDIEVFDQQAWQSGLRCDTWQVYAKG